MLLFGCFGRSVQISERAKQFSTNAQATSKASKAGMEAVQSTNRTMEAIREQSEAVAQNVVTLRRRQ
jgi:methyl-accepting chemotaxis protein